MAALRQRDAESHIEKRMYFLSSFFFNWLYTEIWVKLIFLFFPFSVTVGYGLELCRSRIEITSLRRKRRPLIDLFIVLSIEQDKVNKLEKEMKSSRGLFVFDSKRITSGESSDLQTDNIVRTSVWTPNWAKRESETFRLTASSRSLG